MLMLFIAQVASLMLAILACAFSIFNANKARKNLCVVRQKQARRWLQITGIAAAISAVPAVSSLEPGAMVLSLTVGCFALVLANTMHSQIFLEKPERVEGSVEDYNGLIARFAPKEILSREEYLAGNAVLDELKKRCDEASQFPYQGRLNKLEWRYFHELMQCLWQYSQTQADLLFGQDWVNERQSEIEHLERIIEETKVYADEHSVKFDRADGLILAAEFDLSFARSAFTQGGGILPFRDQLAELERRLPMAIKRAEKALSLLKSKQDGTIRFEHSVLGLFYKAYRALDAGCPEEAENLLAQALHQAEHPDAGAEKGDLPLVLEALAIVMTRLGKIDRSKWYFEQLVEVARERDDGKSTDLADAMELLAQIHCARQCYEPCQILLENALEMRLARDPQALGALLHTHENLALVLEKLGNYPAAEHVLRKALSLASKHRGFMGDNLHLRWALLPLIAFLSRMERHKEALKCLRRLRKADPRPIFELSSELRLFADIHRANGFESEAAALEERARLQDSSSEDEKERNWNWLEHLSTKQALQKAI